MITTINSRRFNYFKNIMRARIKSLAKTLGKFKKQKGLVWQGALALCLIFVAALVLYSPRVFPVPPADAQNNTPNMSGWAWSSNIGWISVNCANTSSCAANGGHDWGLTMNPEVGGERAIVGYAWNEKIGWIKFDPEPAPAPDPAYPTSDNTLAKKTFLRTSDNRVLGWARACNVFATGCSGALKSDADRGGWDGWISIGRTDSQNVAAGSINQNPYGVRVTTNTSGSETTYVFDHFAWGQTIIGWIDFNPGLGEGVTCCDPQPGSGLFVTRDGSGSGDVNSINPPTLIACGFICEAPLFSGDMELVASPRDGSVFAGWSSNCTPVAGAPNRCRVSVDAGTRVVVNATFNTSGGPTEYRLGVSVIGKGSVSGTDSGGISDCRTECSKYYLSNDMVVLVATPNTGEDFLGWSDNCVASAANPLRCTVTVDSAKTVTARFTDRSCPPGGCGPITYNLTISLTGNKAGSVTKDGTVLCTKTESELGRTCVFAGTALGENSGVVTASEEDFRGWSGCSANSEGMDCNYNISSGNQTITAQFSDSGTPPCITEADISVRVGASGVLTTALTSSGNNLSNSSLWSIKNNSGTAINTLITGNYGLNVVGSGRSNPEHLACLRPVTSAGAVILPANYQECRVGNDTFGNTGISIPTGATRSRGMVVYAPSRGTGLGVGQASPYLACNSGVSGSNCPISITVRATPAAPNACTASEVTVNALFQSRYTDTVISPQQAN